MEENLNSTENEDQFAPDPVRLISANKHRVSLNEFAFYRQMDENMTITRKLVMRIGGRWNWYFELVAVLVESFNNREEFDQVMMTRVPDPVNVKQPLNIYSKIPFVVAVRKLGPQLCVNMKYVLENATEEQKQNYRLKVEEIGEKGAKRMVLNSFLKNLLGHDDTEETEDPKGRFCISDFHYFGRNGLSDYYATARHGKNYLFFYYSVA